MRKFLIAIGVLLPITASAWFSDVPSEHRNFEAISYVYRNGIVSGYPDRTFRPDISINRAEFAKIIIGSNFTDRALQYCVDFGFPDTSRTAWYAKYICLAAQHQIIAGYPDGSYRPDASINFVEAAKIIATVDNFYLNGVYYNNVQANGVMVGLPLPESEDGVWYEPYVRYLAKKSAIPMSIQRLDQPITRGEMAEMIWRLKANVTGLSSQTYESLSRPQSSTLEDIRDWTGGIDWSATRTQLYPNSIPVSANDSVPRNTVSAQSMTAGKWNIGRGLDAFLKQEGWMENPYLAADGVTGSQWGYQKREGDATRFLIFHETSSQCTPNVDAPGVTCAYHETTVFHTDPVNVESGSSSSATTQTIPYRNATYGFHLSLPAGTSVEGGNGEFFELPIVIPGTNLTEKYLRISEESSSQCSVKGSNVQTQTINGNVFSKATDHDVGAGQIYNATNFALEHRGTCITFSFVLHSGNPDTFDPPLPLYDTSSESAIFEEILRSLTFE